jgi:glycine cleavage system T protein (aminomethyltransferase)
MRKTPLHHRHQQAGARLVPFAGWEMPVQYEGIKEEHQTVRSRAGVFDVSHMGEVEASGPQALAFLQRVFSNDVAKVPLGGAQYSVLCRDDGGVLDDLFTYRLGEDRYLTVTNASNHERDFEWMREQSEGFEVEVADRHADYAMLALQGPRARAIAETLAAAPLPARMTCVEMDIAGVPALVAGTGYTGEDGLELLLPPDGATAVWDALTDAGAAPVGLGARDTLRLEVCFHLYGNELSEERDPITSGLGWCCKEETGFIGAETVARVRAEGPAEKLVAFKLLAGGIARGGNPIVGGGEVTSGTMSPSLGIGAGMAYVPADRAEPGTEIEIDVRGRIRPAEIVTKPLYRREES